MRGAPPFAMTRCMRAADQPIRISLTAPNGRMGQAIAAAVAENPAFALDQDHADAIVDFSAPAALAASLNRAISANVPSLIGTTGLDDFADQRIAEAAKSVAVLRAPNTSLGVALLAELVERAAKALGPDWDIQVSETHHRNKVDAPSGTALMLGKVAEDSGRLVGYASLRGGTNKIGTPVARLRGRRRCRRSLTQLRPPDARSPVIQDSRRLPCRSFRTSSETIT